MIKMTSRLTSHSPTVRMRSSCIRMWLVRGLPADGCATPAKAGPSGSRGSLSQGSPIPQPAPKNLAKIDLEPWTLDSEEATRQRQLDNHRQNENVRRFFLRPADLPRQGTDGPFQRLRPTPNFPPRVEQRHDHDSRSRMTPDEDWGGKFVDEMGGGLVLVENTQILTVFCTTG